MEVFLAFLLQFLLAVGGVIAIAYLAACLFLFLRQTRFIFKPPRIIKVTPASFNLDYEEVWIPIGTTTAIHGWWIPASANPEAVVWLYLHGNGSNVGDVVKRGFWFHQQGFSSLLIDYRGYGRSPGKFPTESSVYEDVEAAWNYLTQVRQIPAERIFLYGHSLGGAIAIELAQHHPEIAGLAVEGTFTTMRSMVGYRQHQLQMFPVDLILNQRFDSLSKVRRQSPPQAALSMPVLFIHGTADRDVPAQMSQALFAAASEPKRLLLVPEAEHHTVGELGGEQYLAAIQWLVEQARIRQVCS